LQSRQDSFCDLRSHVSLDGNQTLIISFKEFGPHYTFGSQFIQLDCNPQRVTFLANTTFDLEDQPFAPRVLECLIARGLEQLRDRMNRVSYGSVHQATPHQDLYRNCRVSRLRLDSESHE
jgi:hypothetical protein